MLSAHNIVAGYVDEIDILQNVSIDAEREQITSVIGPNGSGKSTLVRVICGFLHPKAGKSSQVTMPAESWPRCCNANSAS